MEAQGSLDKTAIMILDPKVIHNEWMNFETKRLYKLFFPILGCSTIFPGEVFLQAFTGCVSDINWFQYMVLTEKMCILF